jgi:hypothetical protein
MQHHWRGMGPHRPKRAWRVQWLEWPTLTSVFASHESRSAVRYNYFLHLSDLFPDVKITQIRVTRAPEYDELAARQDPFRFGDSYQRLASEDTASDEAAEDFYYDRSKGLYR